MGVNKFFDLYESKEEQALMDDLISEAIQINGLSFYYLPRTRINQDDILGEATLSEFNKSYEIEMYVVSTEGFENGTEFLMTSGLGLKASTRLVCSMKTWREKIPGMKRPMEGDLIFFPKSSDKLFVVKYVEDKKQFYQLGNLYSWELSVEMFDYANEKIRTGIPQIDNIENRYVNSSTVLLSGVTGTFKANETIYQGASLVSATFKAEVLSYSSGTLIIKHMNNGTLNNSQIITGVTSGAIGTVTSSNVGSSNASDNELYKDNQTIQDLGEDIVTFNPKNPFGGR